MELVKTKVIFGVRLDKNRGILIETLTYNDVLLYFRHNDQALDRHCEGVQAIIRSANVKRSKKVRVDLTRFSHEYRCVGNDVWFKTNRLSSERPQYIKSRPILKIWDSKCITISESKELKLQQQNERKMKKKNLEEAFQLERARRIHELMKERLRGTPMDQD